MIAYQCYATGEYAGPMEVFSNLLPNGATWDEPPAAVEGFARFYKNGKWEQVEDHRKEEGYVNGEKTVIREAGPLPEGWSTEPPSPTTEELAGQRKQEILTELDRIDRASARSLRAILTAQSAGKEPDSADVEILMEHETDAKKLRAELAGLNA